MSSEAGRKTRAHASFTAKREDTWLTISLSEAFYGWHYKLVAGVIVAPVPAGPSPVARGVANPACV